MIPKFKAYLPNLDLILPVISIDFERKEVMCENIEGKYWFEEVEDGETAYCELLQSTGIKDGNGIEIFEGDILKHYGDNFNSEVIFHSDGENLGFFVRELGVAHKEKDPRIHSFHAYTSKMEIIGNIYSHA